MMLQANYFTLSLTWLGIQLVAGNADHYLKQDHLLEENKGYLNTEDPKGFGYSVRDNVQQTGHFRKEQRDENGVVRGSYGLQDQDGTFRLVRYIADEKGFRADVASNEPGIGNQNPASVSINRFPNPQITNKETRAPETSRNNENNPEKQDWTHQFFRPVKHAFDDQNEPNDESKPLDLRKYLSNYPFIVDVSSKQEPPSSDVLWKDYNGNVYGKRNPTKTTVHDDKTSNFNNHNEHPPWYRSDSSFKSKPSEDWPLTTSETSDITNIPRMLTTVHNLGQITPGVLDILLKQPQQKVHKNLPDCGTVNSNVLCKPPPYNSDNYLNHNTSEPQLSFTEDSKSFDTFKTSGLDSLRQIIETTFADRLYRFSESADESSPLRASRTNFALQSDLSKYFPSMKTSPNTRFSCAGKIKPHDDHSGEKLSSTSALIRPVIYNTISNTNINSYGENWRNLLPKNNVNPPHQLLESELAQNRDINKYNVLNNKRLVLLTPQNAQEVNISALKALERLNVIGFILLPQDKKEQGVISETDPIKTSEFFNSNTDYRVGPKNSVNNNPNKYLTPIDQINLTLDLKSHKTTESASSSSNNDKEIRTNDEKTLKPNEEINDSLLISKPEQFLRSNSSEFLILDEVSKQGHEDSKQVPDSILKNETETVVNWRKVFEDELNEEYKRTSSASNPTNTDPSESDILGKSGILNERVFQIHDPPSPLYDSRGVPIKSENVPLHLHRYIPSTGVTSLPWKFAIPRPGPPRSISLPQKPSSSS